ncbi:MAG: triose-phosphate isomerase [Chloroflexi bacterium]|nr:MAG: triose-phosphate isomerase [Actinobacteria bacterium 13_2_20CM_2_66_6]TMB77089.1 MAG: triose-phosphate isomerase [Chloroflexota bacterium]TMF69820.1 MAG: triose-phosphate isomerase [Chloroflexota bacterium]TMF75048.1 MAG: triose-phosphate isomerase [Chloroflexota bacterium]TMF92842.1 MAG: triose-phosphate isomerase [Chloroflexota bacterium]
MPLVAANWKMNPSNIDDALDLVRGVLSVARGHADRVEVSIFPPFPWLLAVSEVLVESGVKLGAQDCFWEMSGAFTGEVSPAMLRALCQWVIVGHSERRVYLGETDEMVAKKAAAALSCELSVIMCVGELADHYDAGTSDQVVSAQVRAGLANCTADDSARLVIAYEPVWAIGTGKNADPEHAYKTMRLIRKIVGEMIGAGAARKVRILYGGSVNSGNVQAYVELPYCDGCLVGGASLDASEFAHIVRVTAEVYGHR